jgi:SHS2 domain-containing protein
VGEFRLVEGVALADYALDLSGRDLDDLFATAADALLSLMVDPATVRFARTHRVSLAADDVELLLHDWLAELIFLKDRDRELFGAAEVRVTPGPPASLAGEIRGAPIDAATMVLRGDPKAVTLHQLVIERAGDGWRARVVIDV